MAKRKMHVKRVHQIVRNDDDTADVINFDIWIDMARIDVLPLALLGTGTGENGVITNYKLIWNDNPYNPADNIDASNADIQFENANAKRNTSQIEIRDPGIKTGFGGRTSTPDVPAPGSIFLWTIDKLKFVVQGKDTGASGQVIQMALDNLPFDGSRGNPGNRTTSVIRIVNNDLNFLKMTYDDGSPIITDWDTYLQALINGNVDPTDELFLTVEYTDKFTVSFGNSDDAAIAGASGQKIVFALAGNRDIENLFFQGDLNQLDADGNSAVIRLDPFQTIVNVGSNVIAVKFKAGED